MYIVLFIPQQYKRLTMKFKNGWQIGCSSVYYNGVEINSPEDLRSVPAVIYRNTSSVLNYIDGGGKEQSISLLPNLYANSIAMLVGGVLNGLGFAGLPIFAAEEHTKSGKLIQILKEYTPNPKSDVFVIYPDKRFLPLKVRKFIDLLSKHFST